MCNSGGGSHFSFELDEHSTIWLWSINGELLAHSAHNEVITCAVLTSAAEGCARNVLATGTAGGAVLLWDAELALLRRLELHRAPVAALALGIDSALLVSADRAGTLVSWRVLL